MIYKATQPSPQIQRTVQEQNMVGCFLTEVVAWLYMDPIKAKWNFPNSVHREISCSISSSNINAFHYHIEWTMALYRYEINECTQCIRTSKAAGESAGESVITAIKPKYLQKPARFCRSTFEAIASRVVIVIVSESEELTETVREADK